MASGRLVLDRSAEEKYLRGFTASAVDHILSEAAMVGGKDAAAVLRGAAPIGTSKREGQYYRAHGLGHGTFRRSVRAAAIRGRRTAIRGLQARTVGVVIGPLGKLGFTRLWIERGTRQERANPWIERHAGEAFSAAQRGSDAVLALYGDRGHE